MVQQCGLGKLGENQGPLVGWRAFEVPRVRTTFPEPEPSSRILARDPCLCTEAVHFYSRPLSAEVRRGNCRCPVQARFGGRSTGTALARYGKEARPLNWLETCFLTHRAQATQGTLRYQDAVAGKLSLELTPDAGESRGPSRVDRLEGIPPLGHCPSPGRGAGRKRTRTRKGRFPFVFEGMC